MGKKFKIIYIDPPYSYNDLCRSGKRGAGFKYQTMTDDDLLALPINEIADDDCALFLWITMPRLDFAFKLIQRWSFTFKNCAFSWIKTNKKNQNTLFWGMGNYTRGNNEICLLATKGKPKRVSASVHQVVMSPIEQHSKKPDEVRKRIVELMGDVSRIEIFARQSIDGWTVIGNDIDGLDVKDALSIISRE